jgi:hypothetical protein
MGISPRFIQFNELVVGQNHPTLTDVANRPLEDILTISGVATPSSFVGFSSIGHTHHAADIVDLATALTGYLTLSGGQMSGQIKGFGYAPHIARLTTSTYAATDADEVLWAGPTNCTVTLPLASVGGGLLFLDPLGDLQSYTVTFATQGTDVASGIGIGNNVTSFTLTSPFVNIYMLPIPGTGWLIAGNAPQQYPFFANDVNVVGSVGYNRYVYVALTAARQFTLPPVTVEPLNGAPQVIELWDGSGAAGAHNVTVITEEGASTKINGVAGNTPQTALSTNYGKRTFFGDTLTSTATNWIMV